MLSLSPFSAISFSWEDIVVFCFERGKYLIEVSLLSSEKVI